MRQVRAKIRFLTPAFIGDAEQKADVLNEKALKGALRFWWRAFLSDPNWDHKTLLEEESNIFGGQNSRSKFAINIVERSESIGRLDLKLSNSAGKTYEGIEYLFYSKIDRRNHVLAQGTYIEPGSSYTIYLTFLDDKAVEPVLKSLWFLENFGGIGARARRGAGSFVAEIDDNVLSKTMESWSSSGEINEENLLSMIQDHCYSGRLTCTTLPHYTSFSSLYSRIKIVDRDNGKQHFMNWMEALNFIGEKMRDARRSDVLNSSAPYHQEAVALHQFSRGNSYTGPDPLMKTAFGLPIIYNFKERDKNGKPTGKLEKDKVIASGSAKSKDRRASPLFIKAGKSNKRYYVVLLLMWSQFLESSQNVIIESSRGSHNLQQPTRKAIDDFLNTL